MTNKYEKLLARALVDMYNSGKKSIKPKNITEKYDDPYDFETFDAVNDAAKTFVENGYIEVKFAGKATNTIKSIKLIDGVVHRLAKAYGLETKEAINERVEKVFRTYENSEFEEIRRFVEAQRKNMESGKSVKGVKDGDTTDLSDYLLGTQRMLSQKEDVLLRNFSEDVFGDSKRFESISSIVCKILGIEDESEREFLQQYHIFKNQVYAAIKGNCEIVFKDGDVWRLDKNDAMQLSQSMVDKIHSVKTKSVLTIENLTTYEAYIPNEDDGMILYLGGFSNNANISLLKKTSAKVYHFGDIDANGYRILHDLQRRVGRTVVSHKMDMETILKYNEYGKIMNKCNIEKFEHMLHDDEYSEEEKGIFRNLLDMGIVIEQEAIR